MVIIEYQRNVQFLTDRKEIVNVVTDLRKDLGLIVTMVQVISYLIILKDQPSLDILRQLGIIPLETLQCGLLITKRAAHMDDHDRILVETHTIHHLAMVYEYS